MHRKIRAVLPARPANDGQGVRLRRIAPPDFALTDPFLMIDEITVDAADEVAAGFPPHPHRGFETLSYMRAGSIEHRDHLGNQGVVSAGGAQWMHAGRGIIHAEMPKPGLDRFHGFQLWLNLPAADKMSPPRWRDIGADEMAVAQQQGASLRLLAGTLAVHGTVLTGPLEEAAQGLLFADLEVQAGGGFELPVESRLRLLLYVYDGVVEIDGQAVGSGNLAVLGEGDGLKLYGTTGAGVLMLGGLPIGEPVVQQGPFVMNTRAEVQQALRDYRDGVLASGLK